METGFEYYAFISYKREDEKWAKWLQNKLESYRLPSVIRKEIPRLPKRIRPIFRDKTDLGAGMLTDSLRKELEKSQYLIVICSPQSAKSEWVGKEIDAFIEMGRANHIIPFIAEGIPNSNDEQECFHPVIKEKIPEALGISVNEIGKQQAFVKVAAKLLDLRFDALWNRFLREQRKRRFIAVVIGLLCLIGIGFIWDYNRTKTEYYTDYIEGIYNPEENIDWIKGLYPLATKEIQTRYRHYRFEYERTPFGFPKAYSWRIKRVLYVNSLGDACEYTDTENHIYIFPRYPILKFEYSQYENGKLNVIKCINAKEKTKIVAEIKDGNINLKDVYWNDHILKATLLPIQVNTLSGFYAKFLGSKKKITSLLIDRDSSYLPVAIHFCENNYSLSKEYVTKNNEGLVCIEFIRDSLNRINRCYWREDYEIVKYVSNYVYDKTNGNISFWGFAQVDSTGTMIPTQHITIVYDKNNNPSEILLISDSPENSKCFVCEYNENGLLTSKYSYSVVLPARGNDDLIPDELFKTVYIYNKKKKKEKEEAYGNDGHLKCYLHYQYYRNGKIDCISYFNALNELRGKTVYEYKDTLTIKYIHYDKTGTILYTKVEKFDDFDRVIDYSTIDKDNNLLEKTSLRWGGLPGEVSTPDITMAEHFGYTEYARMTKKYCGFRNDLENLKLYDAQNQCFLNLELSYDDSNTMDGIEDNSRCQIIKDGKIVYDSKLARKY